ncbi:MAG: Holliday junction resolvase RuvX [Clostridia bacterium]|jgi:putative Holliday junction resolvase|nr:Holliday junction resolvase RuvX [Clostridia bacterium]MCI8980263.1 Holliday junction resolvase RuvX [Clostridia bacterium]MCI9084996.1 Holliday junction resolvase RuvX [Clostridia bacterium]NDO19634.1 Holliday junction resolvase RuvX [Lachnospiraceae bacterium MD329]
MRILGIDYGDARVGVAVSDALGFMAQGVKTIKNTGIKQLLNELNEVLTEYKPEKIVIGLPKNMDGTEGFRAEATYKFANKLKTIYEGEIIFWDERLSSVGAARYLNETNTRGKKRKNVLDTVAACIILEGYLNKNN